MDTATLHRLPTDKEQYRVLIVEDDTEISRLICVNLEAKGLKCISAMDGLSGIQLLKEHQPHLVLLDLMLPGMSGTEILDAIRRESDIPVVAVSALVNESERVAELDVQDQIGKPFSPFDLHRRVMAQLERFYGS